jgi:hypothetical protein
MLAFLLIGFRVPAGPEEKRPVRRFAIRQISRREFYSDNYYQFRVVFWGMAAFAVGEFAKFLQSWSIRELGVWLYGLD